uniref:Uncharacterized protein n=1 Tax=Aeromonas salmonicida subsp. salmonicida TaxID=29491 RepID=A0A189PGH6_AERSS|nr:hypothetical protein [Aeromonas salmonicida subsp. salmonicida]
MDQQRCPIRIKPGDRVYWGPPPPDMISRPSTPNTSNQDEHNGNPCSVRLHQGLLCNSVEQSLAPPHAGYWQPWADFGIASWRPESAIGHCHSSTCNPLSRAKIAQSCRQAPRQQRITEQ